jgi:hypothetical protein
MSLSLVGPAVFEGTYYSEIHVPQFRLEMTVNQTDLTLVNTVHSVYTEVIYIELSVKLK